jgi:hypothetical protein
MHAAADAHLAAIEVFFFLWGRRVPTTSCSQLTFTATKDHVLLLRLLLLLLLLMEEEGADDKLSSCR